MSTCKTYFQVDDHMIHDIKNVNLSIHGRPLVTIPDWVIEEGKLYGLTGETGSGKSTIGRWLGGVDPVYWDAVMLANGSDVSTQLLHHDKNDGRESAARPLYLLQDAYQIFNPYVPIGSHFRDVWKNNKNKSDLRSLDEAHEILCALGIENPLSLFRRKVHQVSLGEAQRMAFVLSFIRPASLRIFDEMFSNVDEPSSRKMLEFLRKFCSQSGQSAVVISHETGILNEFVDSAYVIRDGALERADLEISQTTSQDAYQIFPPLISIRDLVVPGYNSRGNPGNALCRLPELEIGRGENVGLYGASGLGKTTLLKGLLGEHELRWTACTVHSREKPDQSRLTDLDIRYLPQSVVSALNPARTIGVSITEIQDIHQVSDQEKLRLLSLFGLPTDLLRKYPIELSGGEVQRMGIISVLLGKPDLILLDESFSSVDKPTREAIWTVLMDRQKSSRFALLVVSHDVEWLNLKMNRVYRLN